MDTDGYNHTNYRYPLFLCFDQYPSISHTWHIQTNRIDTADIPTRYRMNGHVNSLPISYTLIPNSFSVSINKRHLYRKHSSSYVISYTFDTALWASLSLVWPSMQRMNHEYGMRVYEIGNELTCPFIRYLVGISAVSDVECQQRSNLPIYKSTNYIYVPHSWPVSVLDSAQTPSSDGTQSNPHTHTAYQSELQWRFSIEFEWK